MTKSRPASSAVVAPSADRRAFRVVDELGPSAPSTGAPSPFAFPTTAQLTRDGTCLVVDRRNPVNRVVELAPDGRVLWSFEAPPRLNWAWKLDDGRTVAAHRSRLLVLEAGEVVEEHALPLPGTVDCAAVTGAGDLLLASMAGIYRTDFRGTLLAHWSPGPASFVEPTDVFSLPDGGALVADAVGSCVVELAPDGTRRRILGRWHEPGRGHDGLRVPLSACRCADGTYLVADTRAHRLVVFDADGGYVGPIEPQDERAALFAPAFVREAPDGSLVVADTGKRRVVRLTRDGAVLAEWGGGPPQERALSFPRSAVEAKGLGILVCDSWNDRVVSFRRDGEVEVVLSAQDGLTIPRAAYPSPDGCVVGVADGLLGRVAVADVATRELRFLDTVRIGRRRVPLRDPHHVEPLDGRRLLIVDSDLGAVLVVDERGRVVQGWGEPMGDALGLADPHHARLFADGSALITDSANDRVIRAAADGTLLWTLDELPRGPDADEVFPPRLYFPRFADFSPAGELVVVDSGWSRIVGVDLRVRRTWSIGPVLDVGLRRYASPELRSPRWVAWDDAGRLLVTDYMNSRVVVLEHGRAPTVSSV